LGREALTHAILSGAGIVGGLAWLILAAYPVECAPPTEATEDFCNRLLGPPLVGMLAGFGALFVRLRPAVTRVASIALRLLFVGVALMVVGNVAEYWFLTELPHEGPDGRARSVAFMIVLFGLTMVLLASTAFGVATLRAGGAPRAVALAFAAALPASVVLGTLYAGGFAAPLGILATIAGLIGVAGGRSALAGPAVATRGSP
jgi:hypothetical protein